MLSSFVSQRGESRRMEVLNFSRKAVGNMDKAAIKLLASVTKRNFLLCSAVAILTCAIIIWLTWPHKLHQSSFHLLQLIPKATQWWKTPQSGSASLQLLSCFSSSPSFSSCRVEPSQRLNPKLHHWLHQAQAIHQTCTTLTTLSRSR